MKRLIIFALLACLLLCGCEPAAPAQTEPTTVPTTETTPPTTEETTPPTTEETTPPTTEETVPPTTEETTPPTEEPTKATEPAPTEPAKVTVYLIEKVVYPDSGHRQYYYDENYNIDYYKGITIEGDLWYTSYFDELDSNGMATRLTTDWNGGVYDSRTLTYTEDGKLTEELFDSSNFSGYQYSYDDQGRLTEKWEYESGMLRLVTHFTYTYDRLSGVRTEDPYGNVTSECSIENGRIMEQYFYVDYSYSYVYEYDEHGNLISEVLIMDGEQYPSATYYYKAVEVDSDRVPYLLSQQEYLVPIA
jgi:hypothetical protein